MLTLTRDSRVAMATFGGFQSWLAEEGKKFYFDFVKESNSSFTIVQSGLNLYVFETSAIQIPASGG